MLKARDLILDRLPRAPLILDVGGRNNSPKERSYREVWEEAAAYWVADIEEGPNVTHLMEDPYSIPAADSALDLVVCGQTLEHVKNPFRLAAEMKRVLKPGGFVVLIAPSSGPRHGEIDCWRFMDDAFTALAEEVGFESIADWVYSGDSGGGRGRKWDDHVFVGRKP